MPIPRILVPTDFNASSNVALEQGIALAKATAIPLTLLHIATGSDPNEGQAEGNALCNRVLAEHGIDIDFLVEQGDLFDDIGRMANERNARFVVIGTQGIKGIGQHLFGARILKVLKSIEVPAVVVQDKTEVRQAFKKILVLVDDIVPFDHKVASVVAFAKWFNAEVMLYAIKHPMSDEHNLRANIKTARHMLKEANVPFEEREEEPLVFSAGLAKQTLQFAEGWGADLIAISMAEPEVNAKMNQADCERILNNPNHVAVLCTPETLDKHKLFE